jgi:hypothetical protein
MGVLSIFHSRDDPFDPSNKLGSPVGNIPYNDMSIRATCRLIEGSATVEVCGE